LRKQNYIKQYVRQHRVEGGKEFYESRQEEKRRLLSAKMKRQGRIAELAAHASMRNVKMTANPEKEAKFKRGKEIAEKRRLMLTSRLEKKDEHIAAIRERREAMLASRAIDGKIRQEERQTRVSHDIVLDFACWNWF